MLVGLLIINSCSWIICVGLPLSGRAQPHCNKFALGPGQNNGAILNKRLKDKSVLDKYMKQFYSPSFSN